MDSLSSVGQRHRALILEHNSNELKEYRKWPVSIYESLLLHFIHYGIQRSHYPFNVNSQSPKLCVMVNSATVLNWGESSHYREWFVAPRFRISALGALPLCTHTFSAGQSRGLPAEIWLDFSPAQHCSTSVNRSRPPNSSRAQSDNPHLNHFSRLTLAGQAPRKQTSRMYVH